MEISDYIKAESQKNVIYYLLPGLISFWPYAIIMYKYADMGTGFKLSDYLVFIAVGFAILSMGFGTLVEDIACRLEIWLESVMQVKCKIAKKNFDNIWEQYLVLRIKKEDEITVNRYYKALLLRLKFEMHTLIALLIMLIGHLALTILYPINIHWGRTITYVTACLVLVAYLLFEAYKGIGRLHELRETLCKEF